MTTLKLGQQNASLTALQIPPGYDLVLLSSGISLALSSSLGFLIWGLYRKRAGIQYPFLYATEAQCRKNPAAFTFNCAQRCHANYVENLLPMVGSMLIAGLENPRQVSALGIVWIVARGVYSWAYINTKYEDVAHKEGAKVGRGLTPIGWWIPQWALHCLAITATLRMTFHLKGA